MYLNEEVAQFATKFKHALQQWGNTKIDELTASRPRLKAASVYLKRGLGNYLEREAESVKEMVGNLALFIADKDGKINVDSVFADVMTMFKEMDTNYSDVGGFGIEYGKGEVNIHIPRNVLYDMIFGDLGHIKITAADLLELKNLIQQPTSN